jgi:hypothetical protein
LLLGGREEAGKTNTAHTCTHEERGRESKGEAKGKRGEVEEEKRLQCLELKVKVG